MNAKLGRPTDNPKNIMIRVRMDEETVKTMDECAKQLNTTRSEIIRTGIKKVYADIKKIRCCPLPTITTSYWTPTGVLVNILYHTSVEFTGVMKMNSLQIFKNEQFGEIRSVIKNNEIMFVAADVCKALDLSNPSKAVSRLDDDETG